MKYLKADIPWENIKAVGFDMDGTLYDEFDFIDQVYGAIAPIFSTAEYNSDTIKKIMLERWLEKGSSYPHIFSEVLDLVGCKNESKTAKISEALAVFRTYEPKINIRNRIKFLLELLKEKYQLFLVSDGSSKLQWNKIRALKLSDYFAVDNIFISGDCDVKNANKSNTVALNYINALKNGIAANEVVFVGDRSVDVDFAKNAGFYYIGINEIL